MADSKRIKIQVISVGTPKEVGTQGAKVTQFKGIDPSTNEEKIFECWSSTLLEEIKPEAEIDIDVVHTVNETDSGIYEHNKVTQIYKDGQPVKAKPGGSRGSDDSPEKRASIERQKAAELIVNLRIAGVIDDNHNLYQKALSWCGTVLQPTSATAKPEATKKADAEAAKKDIEELWTEDKPSEPAPIERKGFMDMTWLEGALDDLKAKKLKAGTESNLLSYMKTTYKIEAATVMEGAVELSQGQAAHFAKVIQNILDMA